MNVKLNDNVVVISGKYAGKHGKVVNTFPKTGRVTVEGVNIQKKTQKARRANDVSRIIEREGPIDASNVMVVCPSCDKAIRVRYDVTGPKKVRVCPKCGAVLDKAYTGRTRANAAKAAAEDAEKEAPKKRERKRAKKAEKTADDDE